MRFALFLLCTSLWQLAISAATVGPDGFGYSATDQVNYNFIDISGNPAATAALTGTDDSTTAVNLGFNFSFYGTTYTSLFASSNGLVTFGAANTAFTNEDLTSNPAQAAIAAYWDDLIGGTVYSLTSGAPGSQQFVLQWSNWQHFSSSPQGITFEIVLNEGSDDILVNYQNVNFSVPGADGGASATLGIKDSGAQGANRLLWSFNQAGLTDRSALLYSHGAMSPVPEPGSITLVGLGLGSLGFFTYRRKRRG